MVSAGAVIGLAYTLGAENLIPYVDSSTDTNLCCGLSLVDLSRIYIIDKSVEELEVGYQVPADSTNYDAFRLRMPAVIPLYTEMIYERKICFYNVTVFA